MTTLVPTLYTRTFPRAAEWLRDALLLVGGVLLLAGLAQVEIVLPFTPVPITGQTFGVLLLGAALGARRGAATIIAYLAAGGLGLPFFAGGGSGLRILGGATAGYLAGFILAAYVVGRLCKRGLERSLRTSLIPFLSLCGYADISLCGYADISLCGYVDNIATWPSIRNATHSTHNRSTEPCKQYTQTFLRSMN